MNFISKLTSKFRIICLMFLALAGPNTCLGACQDTPPIKSTSPTSGPYPFATAEPGCKKSLFVQTADEIIVINGHTLVAGMDNLAQECSDGKILPSEVIKDICPRIRQVDDELETGNINDLINKACDNLDEPKRLLAARYLNYVKENLQKGSPIN